MVLNILLTKINSPSLQKWNIFEARFSSLVTKNVSIKNNLDRSQTEKTMGFRRRNNTLPRKLIDSKC